MLNGNINCNDKKNFLKIHQKYTKNTITWIATKICDYSWFFSKYLLFWPRKKIEMNIKFGQKNKSTIKIKSLPFLLMSDWEISIWKDSIWNKI